MVAYSQKKKKKSKHNCALSLTTLPEISCNIQGREMFKSITGISFVQCTHELLKSYMFKYF